MKSTNMNRRSTAKEIKAMVTIFQTSFTLLYIKPPNQILRERTKANIAAKSASVN